MRRKTFKKNLTITREIAEKKGETHPKRKFAEGELKGEEKVLSTKKGPSRRSSGKEKLSEEEKKKNKERVGSLKRGNSKEFLFHWGDLLLAEREGAAAREEGKRTATQNLKGYRSSLLTIIEHLREKFPQRRGAVITEQRMGHLDPIKKDDSANFLENSNILD